MRGFRSCAVLALVALSAIGGAVRVRAADPPLACAQPFPLTNPGFEGQAQTLADCPNIKGTVAPGWNDNTCWDTTKPRIRYALDTELPHSGASSQRIQLRRGSLAQFGQFLSQPAALGQQYTISAWLRSKRPTFVSLVLREQGAPYRTFGSKLVQLTPSWTRYDFDGFADGAEVALLIVTNQRRGTFWVDDVAI